MEVLRPYLQWRTLTAGVLFLLTALLLLSKQILRIDVFGPLEWPEFLCGIYLFLVIVISYRFPINIRLHTKIQMTTVPLYVLAILFAPPLAALIAGTSILAAEILVCMSRKNKAVDVVQQAIRSALFTLLASMVAHMSGIHTGVFTLAWIVAAPVMFITDMLTFGLVMCLLFREPFRQIVIVTICDTGFAEAAQYVFGLLGALAATQALWSLILLLVPTGILYFAYKYIKEMNENTRQFLENLADTVDLRDPYTGGHSKRVTQYTAQILQELALYGPEVGLIITAARVHDIGKIGIPDNILNKPDRLTPEERAIMETHAERGAEFLKRFANFGRGTDIVRYHHECWDGTGYPDKLKGSEIPFGARVIAVADSFDAMTSDRPYRKGMPIKKAAAILSEGRNKQWEAEIVDAFLQSLTHQMTPDALEPEVVLV